MDARTDSRGLELRKFEVIKAANSVAGDAMARAHLPDLAIVKKLAELHGDALVIESQPGEGSTVTVRLPQVKAG